MTKQMNDKQIFLCYAKEDSKKIEEIYDKLIDEDFCPWMDSKNLLAGQKWSDEIQKAIKSSSFILIFFSKCSVSKRGYVQRESKLALDSLEEIPEDRIFIIPVRLDDCKIPDKFNQFQYCDLFEEGGYEEILISIKTQLQKLGVVLPNNNIENKLKETETSQLELRYRGLKALIENGSGYGFVNADMGHLAYVMGSIGKVNYSTWGDSPKRNILFQELSNLSKELKVRGVEKNQYVWWYDFSDWEKFCQFASDIYKKRNPNMF